MKFESLRSFFNKADFGLLILRVGLGGMMAATGVGIMLEGSGKLEFLGNQMSLLGLSFWPVFWGLLAALSMTVGGFFAVIGYLFRLSCFFIFFTMFVAVLYHINDTGIDNVLKDGGHALKTAIAFLAMMFTGPGRFSVQGAGRS